MKIHLFSFNLKITSVIMYVKSYIGTRYYMRLYTIGNVIEIEILDIYTPHCYKNNLKNYCIN